MENYAGYVSTKRTGANLRLREGLSPLRRLAYTGSTVITTSKIPVLFSHVELSKTPEPGVERGAKI